MKYRRLLVLISLLLSCTTAPKPKFNVSDFPRPEPIVYWWGAERDTAPPDTNLSPYYIPYPVIEETTGTFIDEIELLSQEYLMRISSGTQVEIWRVEWCPVGDSCFSPIYYGCIPPGCDRYHLPHSGIILMKIYGLMLGDKLLVWRSHPWPGYENTPEVTDSLCMIPVR